MDLRGLAFLLFFGPTIVFPLSDGNSGCHDTGECLKKLQTFLHLHTLPFATSEAEMDRLCNASVEGYNCSSQLLTVPDCLTEAEKNYFKGFINMAQYMFMMFCPDAPGKEGYRRQDMIQNGGCISKQQGSIDCCVKQSKVPDLPVMQIMDSSGKSKTEKELEVCCPMANFLNCTESITLACGLTAANLTTEYFRRAAGEVVQGLCQNLRAYPNPDPAYCSDPVPQCSGCQAVQVSLICIFLICAMSLAYLLR